MVEVDVGIHSQPWQLSTITDDIMLIIIIQADLKKLCDC